MADKEKIACDEEVTDSGTRKSKTFFDVSEDTAFEAARDEAEQDAKTTMATALGKIKGKYACENEDCPKMVVKRQLDTEVTCRPGSRKDPDTLVVENGYKCKAACNWTVTVDCRKS